MKKCRSGPNPAPICIDPPDLPIPIMTLSAWLSLAAICTMGAMSPGPSLALVMRNTLSGSRSHGVLTAVAHGLGVGLYAFLTAAGLAVLVTRSETLFDLVRYCGAAFLVYLGLKALLHGTPAAAALSQGGQPGLNARVQALRDGFLMAFLNPKLAVFFVALFSQFVQANAPLTEKTLMALLAALIDTIWYVLVALALSHSAVLEKLRSRMQLLDRLFGIVLIGVAARVLLL
jgi:threonine/homoserine/homoserine lactone efflux protein